MSSRNFLLISIFFSIIITDKDLSYDHLASGLKEALKNDKSVFDAARLQKYTGALCFLFH